MSRLQTVSWQGCATASAPFVVFLTILLPISTWKQGSLKMTFADGEWFMRLHKTLALIWSLWNPTNHERLIQQQNKSKLLYKNNTERKKTFSLVLHISNKDNLHNDLFTLEHNLAGTKKLNHAFPMTTHALSLGWIIWMPILEEIISIVIIINIIIIIKMVIRITWLMESQGCNNQGIS